MGEVMLMLGGTFVLAMVVNILVHRSDRNTKMKLLKQHPEQAKQILESIDRQEAEFNGRWKSMWGK